MSVDPHFFSKDNFNFLKEAIVKEIKNRYKYDMGNQIDEDIFKIMQYVHIKAGGDPPPGTSLENFLNMMNQKVYELIINRMQTKLENNPEDMLEARRKERALLPPPAPDGERSVQSAMQISGVDTIEGARVIEEPPLMGTTVDLEQDDATVNRLHQQDSWPTMEDIEEDPFVGAAIRPSDDFPQESQRPDQVDLPSQHRDTVSRFLTIDSRFRHISLDHSANSFTVQFPHQIDLVSLCCVDLMIPTLSRRSPQYLLLKIEQLNGQYYENDIFAKLIPTGIHNCYRPAIAGGVKFGFPQRLQELTLSLLTPNRQPYNIEDTFKIKSLEKARTGNVQIVLENPISSDLLDAGDRISFSQFLSPETVEIASQEFKSRMQGETSAWVYGNFENVTPRDGDLVQLISKDESQNKGYFYRVLDGTDRGAILVEGITEELVSNLDRCTFICYSDGQSKEWYTKGIYQDRFWNIVKVHKDRSTIDKIEVEFKYEDLADRDHLGDRKMMVEHLQVSYTFKMELRI